MARRFGLLVVALPLVLSTGCALCCAPYDCHYPYVGGKWVRENPTSGRVGSVFDPAGSPVEGHHLAEGEQTPTPAQLAPETQGPSNMRSVMPRRNGNSYLPTE